MTQAQAYTLSELQQQVKATLTERFALPVRVVAEVAELKVNYSGHCYLELIEKGLTDGVPRAQCRGVIWRSHYPRLAAAFAQATGQPLGAGMKILVKATVNYHELYGFSLQITDLDPSYTLGEMELRRQATIARLQQEGVWELNRSQPMPLVVQRVAILSSSRAAGYRDFVKEVEASPYRFELTLFEAVMQGEAAEDSLIAALYEVASRREAFDAVVIIRGGGSTGDLNCFNSYNLSNHVAQFPLPVLTGIGHDKDLSVCDMVAHTSLKTPTAVAGWLVERMQQVEGWLDNAALQLHDNALQCSHDELLHLERLKSELQRRSGELLTRERVRMEGMEGHLPEALEELLKREQTRLEQAEALIESRDPRQILRLGFSILRREGRAILRADELHPGDEVKIEMTDGSHTAHID